MLPSYWSPLSCLRSVTSSEKVDKAQRYADFTLLSVPYPGKTLNSDLLSLHQFKVGQVSEYNGPIQWRS